MMVRQRATGQAPCRCSWCCVSPTPSGVRLGTWLGSAVHAHGALASRHSHHRACFSMLLLLLAVLSFHSVVVTVSPGASETAAGDGRRTRIAPASMLLLLLAVLWPIRRTIGVMVRQ